MCLSALPIGVKPCRPFGVAWFLRAIELEDGRWECRWGSTEYDAHPDADAAVAHLRDLAGALRPGDSFELFLHHLDGTITCLDPYG